MDPLAVRGSSNFATGDSGSEEVGVSGGGGSSRARGSRGGRSRGRGNVGPARGRAARRRRLDEEEEPMNGTDDGRKKRRRGVQRSPSRCTLPDDILNLLVRGAVLEWPACITSFHWALVRRCR